MVLPDPEVPRLGGPALGAPTATGAPGAVTGVATGAAGRQHDMVQRLLATVRHHVAMDVAWVSLLVDGCHTVEWVDLGPSIPRVIRPGDMAPAERTIAGRVALGLLPAWVADTSAHPSTASLATSTAVGIGAYVTTPIRLGDSGGEALGMVCCASRSTSDRLGEDVQRILRLVADLIGEVLLESDADDRHRARVHERVASTVSDRRFRVVFQPVYCLRTQSITGVEALTRFDQPPVRPDAWFGDADSVGLGVELELATLELALSHLPALPHDLYLAVNASPRLIEDPRLLEVLAACDARRVVLEITEHAAIEDYARLLASLHELRRLGVRICIDDLGAGFSSFSHVLELSPHILKIDVSIVRGLDADPARQALAGAAVEMARQLGADLIAEGVETDAELRAAAELGISSVQGYLVAHPAPLPVPEVALEPPESLPGLRRVHGPDAPRQFDLLMLHSPIGVCVVGLDGRFQRVNPALAALLGYRPQDLLRLTFQEITHPDDLSTDLGLLEQCLDGSRTTYRITKRYRRSDGTYVRCDLTVVAVRSGSGAPRCFISQIVDLGPDD